MVERILVGAVVGAQGLAGLLRVKSFTANPGDLAAYGPVDLESADGKTSRQKVAVKVTGQAKGVVIVRAAGVADRTQAEALKGARLFVAREALPEVEADEFYLTDLIGLAAEAEDGRALGTVKAIHDFGAGEVIELAGIDLPGLGASLMLPFTQDVVPVVDLANRRLVVVVPAMTGSEVEDRDAEEEDVRDAESGDGEEALDDARA
jgi:16S rRNA processing protein RimM